MIKATAENRRHKHRERERERERERKPPSFDYEWHLRNMAQYLLISIISTKVNIKRARHANKTGTADVQKSCQFLVSV